jgi:hypothetical protein
MTLISSKQPTDARLRMTTQMNRFAGLALGCGHGSATLVFQHVVGSWRATSSTRQYENTLEFLNGWLDTFPDTNSSLYHALGDELRKIEATLQEIVAEEKGRTP